MCGNIKLTNIFFFKKKKKVLYDAIHSSTLVPEITDLLNQNVTFFLPVDLALNASIASGKLNFSSNAYNALNFLTLNGSHYTNSFSSSRNFYTTNSLNQISIGPSVTTNYQLKYNLFEIYAGLTKAKIVSQDIQCSNGTFIEKFSLQMTTCIFTEIL